MTTQLEVVKQQFNQMAPEFKKVLPPEVTPEKFVRVVMTAVQSDPNLLSLDRQSLYEACMKAAQEGLLLDKKEAALVPFKGKVMYIPMVQGVIKKVRKSGELVMIASHVVYKNDEFDYWVDETGEHLKHKPNFIDRGEVILTYAMAQLKDGGVYIEVMTEAEVMKVKATSRASTGPWHGPFEDEMRKKTAIRRLAKRLPTNSDLEFNEEQFQNDMKDIESEQTPTEKPKSRLHAAMEIESTVVSEPVREDDIPI